MLQITLKTARACRKKPSVAQNNSNCWGTGGFSFSSFP
jgi:hypothetical protein